MGLGLDPRLFAFEMHISTALVLPGSNKEKQVQVAARNAIERQRLQSYQQLRLRGQEHAHHQILQK